jgi:hypothetical protein
MQNTLPNQIMAISIESSDLIRDVIASCFWVKLLKKMGQMVKGNCLPAYGPRLTRAVAMQLQNGQPKCNVSYEVVM